LLGKRRKGPSQDVTLTCPAGAPGGLGIAERLAQDGDKGSAVAAGYLKRVVVMRRCLVVANQTLQAAELRDELRERVGAGACSFVVIVPDTRAAQYDPVAAGGVLPQPGM